MSVKVINHIYYATDDVPKAKSPTQTTRRLPDELSNNDGLAPSSSSASRVTQSTGAIGNDSTAHVAAKVTGVEEDPSREPPAVFTIAANPDTPADGQPYGKLMVEQARRAMQGGGAVSRQIFLYSPVGVTEDIRKNVDFSLG
ncbi:hypothetical protein FRC08_010467 [Ceratobasidium sp. 394]|nr:hypothetical protein FRC08_010467 [Ceratobasidium sp. 394]